MTGLAARLEPGDPVSDRILSWPGDPSSKADSCPSAWPAFLHALVLTDQDPALVAAYTSDADPTPVALAAIRRHPAFLLDWLTSPPQTNEVRRSAPLIAAAHWLTARFGLPLILSELGASAGLNLLWDHYALTVAGRTFDPAGPVLTLTPNWTGRLPPDVRSRILDRRGVDLNPLDSETDRLRLLADISSTIAWTAPASRSTSRPACALRSTAPMPPTTQSRALAAMDATGRRVPVARLSMEADGQYRGAALTLTLWPGGETFPLGRADFHGRWIDWQAPQPRLSLRQISSGGLGGEAPPAPSRCAPLARIRREESLARQRSFRQSPLPARHQPRQGA